MRGHNSQISKWIDVETPPIIAQQVPFEGYNHIPKQNLRRKTPAHKYLFLKANEVLYVCISNFKISSLKSRYLRFPCVVPELREMEVTGLAVRTGEVSPSAMRLM